MRRNWVKWLWTLLLIANIAFIWGQSSLPGTQSQQISDEFLGILGFLNVLFGEKAHLIVRKIAHVLEFTSLGVLLAGSFRHHLRDAALCGLLIACVDETIQLCSPGRASMIQDVWIDFAGVLAGIAALYFGYILWKKTRKTNHSKEN